MLLQRGKKATGKAQWLWLSTGGAAGGFGIWATHFIAMLAYDAGVTVGYEPGPTVGSLAIAILTTAAALFVSAYLTRFAYVAAGLLFGVGIASMHYLGMTAIEFPGSMTFESGLVFASIVFAVLFSIAAFAPISAGREAPSKTICAAVMMSLGIVSMHFTAMGALDIMPAEGALDPLHLLSPSVMVVMIATVSFSLLSSGLAAAIFALRAENVTAATEKRFQMLVEGVTDYAIYMLDLEGRVSNWNVGAERAKGYTSQEIVGQYFGRFYSEEDQRKGLPKQALEIARTQGKFEAEGWRYRKDGSSFWAHIVIDPIYNDQRELIGYAKITKDNSKQKADADRVGRITRNLDIALENMSQGICLFDADERLVLSNLRYSEIFRFPSGYIRPGMQYRDILEAGYKRSFPDPNDHEPRADEHYSRHMAIIRAGEGAVVHKLSHSTSIQANYNALGDGGWVVTFEDISERLRSEEKIAFMARHDSLTGLPNRAAFNDHLAQELVVAERTASHLAVVGIDLDKFKEINDQHGHSAGDQVLVALAARMTETLESEEFAARFGGDEFCAVKRFDELPELHDFLGRLEAALFADISMDSLSVKPSASMGVAIYPQDATNAETLLANADLAMYRAKAALQQNVCFYEVAMDEAARSRRSLAKDLWSAIENKQFYLHYQVQKSVSTRQTTGYEVLLRWQHPELGNIPPMQFITLAEECGAILPIGEWVLREACREAASWSEPHKIAVNLSPIQLGHTDLAALVHSVLFETGLSANRLELEITESSIITDKERALHTLRQIKNLGVSIAIDDFGTGYSSRETLRAVPVDKIKLDRSFMNEVERSPQAKAIIRAILALGQSLDVPVLAEGVETQDQLDILLDEGCDEAQGYLLGRPQPIRAAGGMIEAQDLETAA